MFGAREIRKMCPSGAACLLVDLCFCERISHKKLTNGAGTAYPSGVPEFTPGY
jgi:hypothetical protein